MATWDLLVERAQQQLAERSGAHVTQIRRYEAGTRQPSLDLLAFVEGELLHHDARRVSGQAD